MKKFLSKFAENLLTNENLKSVKGGNQYCVCGNGSGPVVNPNPSQDCYYFCTSGGSALTVYTTEVKANQTGNGWG